ncbi:Chromosome (plasmid) partitioning protein ParB (plasmid) [Leptolyngbya boryana IAM M-101]|nr:Chromosome (plasmid) partitioning protein ParB [Leptolyngbya boryana IAM M-101]BAS66686.1 Chromosome (plasmid) partitioning protein ParB [Leptolyngbya boryana dg5]
MSVSYGKVSIQLIASIKRDIESDVSIAKSLQTNVSIQLIASIKRDSMTTGMPSKTGNIRGFHSINCLY